MELERIKLWDLPTRVFHWLLVIFIVAAVITAKIGGAAIDWHARIGLCILGLIAFRLAWGIVGSSHARFANFSPTPASIASYLRGQWQGSGHNPLGALSVIGMLMLIVLQLGTGLFGNDDIAFRGPLADLVSKETSDRLIGIHKLSINVLIALIVLHIGAIAFYGLVKKDNLLKAMVTGWKDIHRGQGKSTSGGGTIALLVALAIALVTVYVGSGAWLPLILGAQP